MDHRNEPESHSAQNHAEQNPPVAQPETPPATRKRKAARRGNGVGSIFRRKDRDGNPGLWVGVISAGRSSSGKRRRRTIYGKTRKEVQDRIAEMHVKKLSGRLSQPSKTTLAEYLSEWLKITAPLTAKPQTVDGYELIIKNEINPRIGGERLTAISSSHIKTLNAEMVDAGKSAGWRKSTYTVLRKALEDATYDGLIPFNPAAAKRLRPKVTKPEVKHLSPEQSAAFLKAAEPGRLYCMYVLAIHTGMRQGELWGLRWEDVDLTNATIMVRRTLIERKGKHSFGEPKSKESRRVVSLTDVAVRELWAHKARMLAEGNSGSECIFCTESGKPLRKSNVRRRSFLPTLERAEKNARAEAEKLGKEPELLPKIHFHCLRHSHATDLLHSGVDVKSAASRLGHSNPNLILTTYGHAVPKTDRDAAAKINALHARPASPDQSGDDAGQKAASGA